MLSQFHEAYCHLGEMQSLSSQKEHSSSDSAVGRAGETATVLLECQECLCWIRTKVHVGQCPPLWQWPVAGSQ